MSYLANGIPKKMQFLYDRELVKFAVFQVPALRSTVYVEVEGLSPHSYPTIYLKHVELKEPMMDLDMLDYPSMNDYEMKLFDDYDAQTGQAKVSDTLSLSMRSNSDFCCAMIDAKQVPYGLRPWLRLLHDGYFPEYLRFDGLTKA